MFTEDRTRRAVLAGLGMAGLALPGVAGATVVEAPASPPVKARHRIRFGVVGLDHPHILGMTAAVQRGGGELVSVHAVDPAQYGPYEQRFGPVKRARSEREVLDDPTIALVLGAPVPDLRAPLGVRAMRAGKHFLSDKPGVTSLAQLAEVRRASRETGKRFAILYSERFEVRAAVKAGELVRDGAIGRVIQTVNLAPHQIQNPEIKTSTRPDWFWDTGRYGGILVDVGSHQADQFLFYTGSKRARVVASQAGNVAHPEHPRFQDFGDMNLVGDGGSGYVRVDWFTPDGLGTWGDGRLFILGTDGYIELRKYVDIAGRPGGDHLLIVDKKGARYMDCSKLELPFGPQFVNDLAEGTELAQDQDQALLAAELVLTAQARATRPVLA